MKTVNFMVATFFGIGKIPFAPGTWASLAAAPFFYFLLPTPLIHALVLIAVYFVGVYSSGQYARSLGETDPSSAVIDEVLGMGVAMFLIPPPQQTPFVIMAFILFRIFDIWKPYPIRRIEKLPWGWGIMTDDLAAGLYALAWVHIGRVLVDYIK